MTDGFWFNTTRYVELVSTSHFAFPAFITVFMGWRNKFDMPEFITPSRGGSYSTRFILENGYPLQPLRGFLRSAVATASADVSVLAS